MDRVALLGTADFAVYNDLTGPALIVEVPAVVPVRFTVRWNGLDPGLAPAVAGSGLRSFTVQYREESDPEWQAWLTETTALQGDFVGTPGARYYFQITGIDNVNNSTVQEVGPIEVKAVTKYYAFSGQKVAMRQGEEVYYLHGDHLGSTSLTTDEGGNVVSEVRYHPYGEERWRNGESVTDFGFTGQRVSGLSWAGYDPQR